MQKRARVSIYIIVAMLFALVVCGSIWDLEIANALYIGEKPSENMFGFLFSFIGVIPTFVGWSFLGTSILYLAKKQVKEVKKRRWLIAFASLLLVLSFFYFCNTIYMSNANVLKIHFLLAYLIGVAVLGVASYLGYRLSRRSEDQNLLKKALFLAVVSLVVLLLISSTKRIMCRPRFRFVLATGDTHYFRRWWQSGRALKASLQVSATSDEFSSFPSGHSAYATFAIFLFPALASYVRGLTKCRPFLFALGLVWWALTAFSRLTVGAHYLSDVVFGGLITILAYAIVSLAKNIYLKRKSMKKV